LRAFVFALVAAALAPSALESAAHAAEPTKIQKSAIRGEPAAIAEAEAMVESMGGKSIWAPLQWIHLVHEWYPWNRVDSYVENEILDLAGPRSWAGRESEIHQAIRAYSPEGKRWTLEDGVFAYGDAPSLGNDLKRAPFNFYRLVRGVAAGDSFYEVRFGEGDVPGTRRLEFYGPDGALGGWVILNARKEPIVKATPDYRYTLGPLKRFGNLRVPSWGVYDNGYTRYEMISLTAGSTALDQSKFMPPPQSAK